MPDERSYMRGDYPGRGTTALVWLVAATISCFLLQLMLQSPWLEASAGLMDPLRLTVRNVQQGGIWTLLTHGFMHHTGNPLHLAGTLLGLILLGRELEPHLGARHLAALFLGAVVVGGGVWLAVHWHQGGSHIGPGAALLALLVVLAQLHENKPLTFMPFFLFPVTVRPMSLIYGYAILEVLLLLLFELPGSAMPWGYTPSAHLGGLVTGWAYFRFFHASNGWDRAPGPALPAWFRRAPRAEPMPPPAAETAPLPSAGQLRAEADRILDKINSQGFGSLTPEERHTLNAARNHLSKR